jgi:hypothetical protein
MAGLTAPRLLAAGDDRDTFDCGRETLNHWFRRHAWRNQQGGMSRTSVVCDTVTRAVAGYVALSAAQIERAHLPRSAQRNRPDPIPVILLGQLALARRYQGKNCAKSLLVFALTTAVRFSKEIGCFGVLTHLIDEGVRGLYHGFEELPFDPERSMIVRIVDLGENGF